MSPDAVRRARRLRRLRIQQTLVLRRLESAESATHRGGVLPGRPAGRR